MPSRFGRTPLVFLAVAFHMAMLAAYTLPEHWVPTRMHYWSQAYVGPIFHQQWELFAPDPPLCSCELELVSVAGDARPITSAYHHFLVRRMALQFGQYIGGAEPFPDTLEVDRRMERAFEGLVRVTGHDITGLRFHAVQMCADGTARPGQRVRRIVPIRFSDR